MVHSPKLAIVTDGKYQTNISFTLGKTIHFGSLEFIADHLYNMSLSPEGNDSGVVFVGMTHSGSPSLHTILEDSVDEVDITSSGGRSFDFPIFQKCNMVTPTVPITTKPP
jgi:hypothetical protein